MTWLRSALFNLFFFGTTFVLSIPAALVSLVAPRQIMGWAKFWARMQIGAARIICGIRVQVSGWENLPPAPVLIASRHESTFDVLFWIAMLPAACFVVKRELTQMPLFGRCILAAGMISVDREAGGAAMRTLLRGGDRAKAAGRHIIIFPEGTRVDPDDYPPLQPGVAALAARTGLQVVPVMTDSGHYWGRLAFRKLPGTIRIAIQPPLAVQPARDSVLEALRAAFQPGRLVDKSVGESKVAIYS
ncbi:MAG: lysophospholipid acyltransferase family protein [Acetobacteraceae bacterium]|jgi:1-acyl-sn-glycerol-3-phosphate acyltransferase